jgi:dolichyl-phosphate-mannose--protein O-mannosyl transferase
MKKLAVFILLLLPHTAANAASCSTLDAINWLLGQWQYTSSAMRFDETWTAVSADTYEGSGTTTVLNSGEINNYEALRLVAMANDIYYLAKVKNNTLPIAFKLTQCAENIAVFENPQHDFPQKIVYRLITPDRINVSVSAIGNDGFILRYQRNGEPETY